MGTMPTPLLTNRFTAAIDFALVAHAAQVRKGTSIPYLSHLLAVASLVIEHDGSEDAAIAAVLHDTPEDQGGLAMVAQIRARFGKHVAEIVDGCTDTFEDPKPGWRPRKERYLRHLSRTTDVQTCLVSGADKLHNARAILHDLRATSRKAEFWKRFSASPEQLGWYYGSLERVLGEKLARHDGREIATELRHALDAIAGLPECANFGAGVDIGRAGGPCPETLSSHHEQGAPFPRAKERRATGGAWRLTP